MMRVDPAQRPSASELLDDVTLREHAEEMQDGVPAVAPALTHRGEEGARKHQDAAFYSALFR